MPGTGFKGDIYKIILFSQVPYEVHFFNIRILRHREVNTLSLVIYSPEDLNRDVWLNTLDLP